MNWKQRTARKLADQVLAANSIETQIQATDAIELTRYRLVDATCKEALAQVKPEWPSTVLPGLQDKVDARMEGLE